MVGIGVAEWLFRGTVQIGAATAGWQEIAVAALPVGDRFIGGIDRVAVVIVRAALNQTGVVGIELAGSVGNALHAEVTDAVTELLRLTTWSCAAIGACAAIAI